MSARRVKDLMVPIDKYPAVHLSATLPQAISAVIEAHRRLEPGRQPYRAVLVKDDKGRVVGKLGQLAFLRALQPKAMILKDVERLRRAGIDTGSIDSLMENYRLLEGSFDAMCRRGLNIRVEDAMHPVHETIDENASLSEAIHKIVLWQQLSLLVKRGSKAVGLIRLSDLWDEVGRQMVGAEQGLGDSGAE